MKKSLLFLFGFFATPFLFSQILTVNSGSFVSIASGSSITLDGLEMAPADTYVISGANEVARSANAVTSGANSSVSRVYSASDLLSGFTDTLSFSYLEAELNGIAEGDLVLELWYLSNLVAFIRLNLFVKVDLQRWLDNPFQKVEPPPKQDYQRGSFLKKGIYSPVGNKA